ncbi:hypothetical protein MUO65_08330 [bacterium]|nr:hypothetical protein [bacterium]
MAIENRKREIELKQVPQTKQLLRLVGRVKLAELIELSERDFAKTIKKIENEPLFKKLFSPSNPQEKVVSYRPFPRSELSKSFYELKEDIAVDRSSPDVVSLLDSRKELIPLIRRLGIDKFKKYFLYNNGELFCKDVSLACNLTEEEVMKIIDLIDDFSIQSEFFSPSMINPGSNISYSKIAKIEKDGSEDFVISFISPYLVKGRYWINYEKLAQLKKNRDFSPAELKKTDRLINNLEAINKRKSITYRIIRKILEIQSIYLSTGNPRDIVPFTQRELARKINTDPSLISRAIARRSIETPWQEEYPLKYFFPNKKRIIKGLITTIISDEKCIYTDEGIRERLKKAFCIDISRRSVASYRKEMKIPSYSEKIKSCKLKVVS